MNKYELTDITKQLDDGTILHRIKALKDIPRYNIKAGDYGGWIESEFNLSHEGDCWLADDAIIRDNAMIINSVYACNYAVIADHARAIDNAHISGHAYMRDYSHVSGNVMIKDYVKICGTAVILDDVHMFDHASANDNAGIWGDTYLFGDACAHGNAAIPQGSYNTKILTISLEQINITAIYPNHIYSWCGLLEICSKKKLMAILKADHIIPEKIYEQIWISMKLCEQWLKDNPEP